MIKANDMTDSTNVQLRCQQRRPPFDYILYVFDKFCQQPQSHTDPKNHPPLPQTRLNLATFGQNNRQKLFAAISLHSWCSIWPNCQCPSEKKLWPIHFVRVESPTEKKIIFLILFRDQVHRIKEKSNDTYDFRSSKSINEVTTGVLIGCKVWIASPHVVMILHFRRTQI